ncbi:hypothetical protein ABZ914_10405 [Spirillospora sp. NPDC046719]
MARAEQSAETTRDSTSDLSVWSFPTERRALFALSVATRTGDPDGALRAAKMLTLDPGMRLTTVTRYLVDLARRLDHPGLKTNSLAAQFRQQIRDFNATALTDDADLESA